MTIFVKNDETSIERAISFCGVHHLPSTGKFKLTKASNGYSIEIADDLATTMQDRDLFESFLQTVINW